jgi:uncharacterized protein YjdB
VRVGLAVVTVACSSGVEPAGSSVDTVVIVPEVATVALGATVTLQAEARDDGGNLLERTAFWSSADSTIVAVTPDGQATGRRLGTAEVAASIEGKSGLSSVTVSRVPVGSVRLVPANATIRVGGTFTFTAEARDGDGGLLSGRPVTWSSSNPAVATVSPSGRVTALAAGATIISADCEGKSGLASVNVSAAAVASVRVTPTSVSLETGETQQLVATPLDASNTPLTGRSVVWSTSSPAIATVTSSGVVAGIRNGSASITATSEGRSGSVIVSVTTPGPTVTVSPSSTTISRDQTVRLTAVFRDDRGRVDEDKNFTWSTSDSKIASVSSSGRVTGRSSGVVTITARASGVSGTATVTVR